MYALGVFLGLSATLPASVSRADVDRFLRGLECKTFESIVRARTVARSVGLSRLGSQFGMQLRGSGLAGQLFDHAQATRLSSRLARFTESKLVADESRFILPKLAGRLETIAITENATAFDAERATAARSEVSKRVNLAEFWDATLDRRTCRLCESMNGAKAGPDGFPGGARPGSVHPRCRCNSHYEATGATNFNLLPYIAAGATYGWLS